jgi:hypothetical protein
VTRESGSRFDTSSFSKASSVYARGLSHEFGGYSAADWACRRLPARANVTPFLPSCVDYALTLRSGLDHCGFGRVPLLRLSGPTAGLTPKRRQRRTVLEARPPPPPNAPPHTRANPAHAPPALAWHRPEHDPSPLELNFSDDTTQTARDLPCNTGSRHRDHAKLSL